jgi:hypothetical protein
MHRPTLMRFALGVGVLAIVMLALTGCGSGSAPQEEAKGRPLPEKEEALSPGEYHSVDFKPSLSFEVGKGWFYEGGELPDFIELGQLGGFITFANVKEVYKPGTTDLVDAPKDMVGWLQNHPYLKASNPEPVTLGGVKGEQFDLLVEELPQDYIGLCSEGLSDCVDIAPLSNDQAAAYFKEVNKRKVIVLEDVKGDTVMIWFAAPPNTFDEFAPKAQKVVDSVKWAGS